MPPVAYSIQYGERSPVSPGSIKSPSAPGGRREGELVPLASYLALAPEEAAGKLPFVWGVGTKGHLRRLIVARRLALACPDRLGTWRTLQERLSELGQSQPLELRQSQQCQQ